LDRKIKRYNYATLPSRIIIGDTQPLRVILKVTNPEPSQTTSLSYAAGEIMMSVSKMDKDIPILIFVDPDNPKFEYKVTIRKR
jgi:hypothetical protein